MQFILMDKFCNTNLNANISKNHDMLRPCNGQKKIPGTAIVAIFINTNFLFKNFEKKNLELIATKIFSNQTKCVNIRQGHMTFHQNRLI